MRATAAAAIGAAAAAAARCRRPSAPPLFPPAAPFASSARRRALELGAASQARAPLATNSAAAEAETAPAAITLLAVGERGTRALARLLARGGDGGGGDGGANGAAAAARHAGRAGDCYFLHGPVGAGKSAFSRAFVRAAADDPRLPVPSPTYLLVNTYDVGQAGEEEGEEDEEGGGGAPSGVGRAAAGAVQGSAPPPPPPPPIHHFDLYRLDPARTSPAELVRLDIPGALASGVALIEWPERLAAIAAAAVAAAAAAAAAGARGPAAVAAAAADARGPAAVAAAASPSVGLVPASRVDVFVEPLADDDPRRAVLAEALRGSRSSSAAGGVRATPLRLGGPGDGGGGPSDEEAADGAEDDDDDDDDDDGPYADRRWRRWTLVPTSREWEDRLRALVQRAAGGGEAVAGAGAAQSRDAANFTSAGGLFLVTGDGSDSRGGAADLDARVEKKGGKTGGRRRAAAEKGKGA